jgi:hypothetical protein
VVLGLSPFWRSEVPCAQPRSRYPRVPGGERSRCGLSFLSSAVPKHKTDAVWDAIWVVGYLAKGDENGLNYYLGIAAVRTARVLPRRSRSR